MSTSTLRYLHRWIKTVVYGKCYKKMFIKALFIIIKQISIHISSNQLLGKQIVQTRIKKYYSVVKRNNHTYTGPAA